MKKFESFGAFCRAAFLANQMPGAYEDARLVRAPTGAGEVDPTGGGFMVDPEFGEGLVGSLYEQAVIAPLCTQISANPKGVKLPAIDETSRANGQRWGGVTSAWIGEGVGLPASLPKFQLVEFSPIKLAAISIVTEELVNDVPALGDHLERVFASEMAFMLDQAILSGSGAGQPLGILNSPALVTVAKQTGQVSGSIVVQNIDGMWQRLASPSRRRAVWLINEDADQQLEQLGFPLYVYGGLAGDDDERTARLKGRPVLQAEQSPALGTPGDIILADLSQYFINRAALKSSISLHAKFLTDEMVFKIILRVDAKPIWATPITPYNGTQTRSAFVGLEQR